MSALEKTEGPQWVYSVEKLVQRFGVHMAEK
jgi:hypothetical protein